jgi:hypothetical protein
MSSSAPSASDGIARSTIASISTPLSMASASPATGSAQSSSATSRFASNRFLCFMFRSLSFL